MKEQLISFKTSKAAFEKGFKQKTTAGYRKYAEHYHAQKLEAITDEIIKENRPIEEFQSVTSISHWFESGAKWVLEQLRKG